MHLEEFAAGTSLLHHMDPRIKIACAVVFSCVMALANRWPVLWTGLATGAVLVLLARLPARLVVIRLAMVNTFILFLWVFLPFSHPGEAVFRLGPLTATREGLDYALAITVKSNAIILAVMALLGTSTLSSLIHALRHFKVPDKLVHLFFFTFRYFQVIHQEYLRLRAAMRVRCFQAKTTLHTYRSLGYLVGMVLVRSFDRSDRVHQAMVCRGYDGRFWVLDHFHLHDRDLVFLAVMMAVNLFLAVAQWTNLLL